MIKKNRHLLWIYQTALQKITLQFRYITFTDYTAGLLLNYQYYIGASYDAYLSDWKWVDGLIVDPVFLMNYLVTGGSGNCLVWDDTYGLSDVPCSTTMSFICEVPVTTSSPPTSLPPMTPSTALTTSKV